MSVGLKFLKAFMVRLICLALREQKAVSSFFFEYKHIEIEKKY